MDWTGCPAVESVEGRRGGLPVIRRSRVRPEDLLPNRSQGEAWLALEHDLPLTDVRDVLRFYDEHKVHGPAAA